MIHKSLAALLISCFSFKCWAQSAEAQQQTMEKAMAIFERLSSASATPLTQEFIERFTGAKLIPPDEEYPPSVQRMLVERGFDPTRKSRFVHDAIQINDEISLKIHFAVPMVRLSFSGQTRKISAPEPLTNEVLAIYLNEHFTDHELAIKKNCIKKHAVYKILEQNGWTLTDHPLSSEIDEEDGNFYFVRLKGLSTVTTEGDCVISLKIGEQLTH